MGFFKCLLLLFGTTCSSSPLSLIDKHVVHKICKYSKKEINYQKIPNDTDVFLQGDAWLIFLNQIRINYMKPKFRFAIKNNTTTSMVTFDAKTYSWRY